MHEKDLRFRVAIVTVSTSRFEKYGNLRGLENIPSDDESGKEILDAFGDLVVDYCLVADDIFQIRSAVFEMLKRAEVCILTGGTGLNPRDLTIEALENFFDKKIDGFGEIFRMKSFEEISYSAILSRATAGIIDGKVIFCLPGSKKAVKLGVEIIRNSVKHILSHAMGQS
ncbi:MAG: MogA/MoaB family molybdenum cofactor biosynthesis protein [Archaeoglobaceae archaeon]|nr:MogA/MoaB family molybdenum cofactor biosynthesis protein [Archaeoglobaceae archaeon]MDW7989244.1 MogA/MoaB family molybdenum cofactor biosynthesis protein [Archaeoglobaceae archaeon]